eukprot:725850_1
MLNYFQQTKQRGSSTKKAKSKMPSASTNIEPPRSKVRRFESPFPTDRSQTLSSTGFEKLQKVNLSPSYFTSPVYTESKERLKRNLGHAFEACASGSQPDELLLDDSEPEDFQISFRDSIPGGGVICGVCYARDQSDLVRCGACEVKVHARCFGLGSGFSDSGFVCPSCAEQRRSARPVSCIVCDLSPSAGVMKRVVRHGSARRLWAHVACVAYRPEDGAVVVDEWEDISGVGVYVDRLGDKKRCSICQKSSRGCVRCNHDDTACDVHFHPTCALRAGHLPTSGSGPSGTSASVSSGARGHRSSGTSARGQGSSVSKPEPYGAHPDGPDFHWMTVRQGQVKALDQDNQSGSPGSARTLISHHAPIIRCRTHSAREARVSTPFVLDWTRATGRRIDNLVMDPFREIAALDGDPCCQVCFRCEDSDSDMFIVCENPLCEISVHQRCYGVSEWPEGSWFCDACVSGERDSASCVLCGHSGGALKSCTFTVHSDGRPQWIHAGCALLCPGVVIGNLSSMSEISVKRLGDSPTITKCDICKQSNSTPTLSCAKSKKCHRFHPMCALSSGRAHVAMASGRGGVSARVLCSKHSPQESGVFWEEEEEDDVSSQPTSPIGKFLEGTMTPRPSPKQAKFRRALFDKEIDEWVDQQRDSPRFIPDAKDHKNMIRCFELICLAKRGDFQARFHTVVTRHALLSEVRYAAAARDLAAEFGADVVERAYQQSRTSLLDSSGRRSIFLDTKLMSVGGACKESACGAHSWLVRSCTACGAGATQRSFVSEGFWPKKKSRKKGKKGSRRAVNKKKAEQIPELSDELRQELCDAAMLRSMDFILKVCEEKSKGKGKTLAKAGGDVVFLMKNVCRKAKKGSEIRKKAHEVTLKIVKLLTPVVELEEYAEESELLVFLELLHGREMIQPKYNPKKHLKQIETALATQTSDAILLLDPWAKHPRLTEKNYCSQCGIFMNAESDGKCARTACYRCARPLCQTVDFDCMCAAMIWMSVFEDVGVRFRTADGESSLRDVMEFLPDLRPYRSVQRIGLCMFRFQCYFVTHLVFIAANTQCISGGKQNCWSDVRLDPFLFVEEFLFLATNLHDVLNLKDPELVGEFVQCLRVFGLPESSALVRIGVDFLLSVEGARKKGAWVATSNFYTRYHAAYCGIIGLAYEGVFPFDDSRPMCERWQGFQDILERVPYAHRVLERATD